MRTVSRRTRSESDIHQHARAVDGYPVNVSPCYEVARSPAYSEESSAATMTSSELGVVVEWSAYRERQRHDYMQVVGLQVAHGPKHPRPLAP